MPNELSQVVQISITANSRTPSRQGFGQPLFLGYHSKFAERYRIYTDLAGLAADGFETWSPQYRALSAIFAQDPAPTSVVVGRLPSAHTHTQTLTMLSAVQGQHVRFKIVDPTTGTVNQIDYTIGASATTTTVATAVELLTEAITGVDSTSSGAVITVTPTTAGQIVYIYDLENVERKDTTPDANYETELSALQLVNDDWYFILIDTQSQANINDVAAWALGQKKIFFAGTSADDELSGVGTLGSTLKAAANDRTVLLWVPNPQDYAPAGWVGVGAPQDPGSITWAFKNIDGVTPKQLTATQRTNLETDNINHYQTLAGLNVTRPGKLASGEWIDIRHGIDALEARIQEDVFALLANSRKVPFTASGLDLIANAVLGAMKAFEGSDENPGLLVPRTSRVIMPDITSISPTDKNARRLTGVRFSADLAGAIHFVSVVGTLSV